MRRDYANTLQVDLGDLSRLRTKVGVLCAQWENNRMPPIVSMAKEAVSLNSALLCTG